MDRNLPVPDMHECRQITDLNLAGLSQRFFKNVIECLMFGYTFFHNGTKLINIVHTDDDIDTLVKSCHFIHGSKFSRYQHYEDISSYIHGETVEISEYNIVPIIIDFIMLVNYN